MLPFSRRTRDWYVVIATLDLMNHVDIPIKDANTSIAACSTCSGHLARLTERSLVLVYEDDLIFSYK